MVQLVNSLSLVIRIFYFRFVFEFISSFYLYLNIFYFPFVLNIFYFLFEFDELAKNTIAAAPPYIRCCMSQQGSNYVVGSFSPIHDHQVMAAFETAFEYVINTENFVF